MALHMWVKLAVLALGLLVMVPESTQLHVDHPLYNVVQKLNFEHPYLGLIISGGRHERILRNSSLYVPNNDLPSLTVNGRTFNIGRFNGVPAIYVLAGKPLANVGVTVQTLIDTFRISGLISYGAAATVDRQVLISNVVVPSSVSYIGAWTWRQHTDFPVKVVPSLVFGDYNKPSAGDNALASVLYDSIPLYTQSGSEPEQVFEVKVDQEWYEIASNIDYGVRPRVVVGENVKVGTSDVIVNNVAYGQYLNNEVGITAVDTESAPVVTTAIANALPSIVFRGASNRPGSSSSDSLSDISARFVLRAVSRFVRAAYITPKSKYSNV